MIYKVCGVSEALLRALQLMELTRGAATGLCDTRCHLVADHCLVAFLVSRAMLQRSRLLSGRPLGATGGRHPAARSRSHRRSRNEVISDRAESRWTGALLCLGQWLGPGGALRLPAG